MNPKAPVPVRPKMTETGIEEQIRQRAYVLYEGRGKADGKALDDWLKAEESRGRSGGSQRSQSSHYLFLSRPHPWSGQPRSPDRSLPPTK